MEDKHEWRSAIHFEADSEPIDFPSTIPRAFRATPFGKEVVKITPSLCYAPPGLQLGERGRAYDHFVAPHEFRRVA